MTPLLPDRDVADDVRTTRLLHPPHPRGDTTTLGREHERFGGAGRAPRSDLAKEAARSRAGDDHYRRGSLGAVADADVLERIALALNAALDLKTVFRLLGEVALDVSGAEHCSLLLIEGTRLRPAYAVGGRPNATRWTQFRSLRPIEMDESYLQLFAASRAVPIEDARRSGLVPPEWADAFCLGAMILVPLRFQGDPLGLMAVDWTEPRAFDPGTVALLETIGAYAGLAVRNARLFERVQRHAQLRDALARAAATLAAPSVGPDEIARRLLEGYVELFGARLCALGISDRERSHVTVLAVDGTGARRLTLETSGVPRRVADRLRAEWAGDKRPLEFHDEPWFTEALRPPAQASSAGGQETDETWYLLIPLVVEGRSRAAVVLGFERETDLEKDERDAAEALASIAATALERHELLDRLALQVRRLDTLYRAIARFNEETDAHGLVVRLNDILAEHGIEVLGLAFRDRGLARFFGGAETTPEEKAVWRSGVISELPDHSLAVPLHLGRRVVGTLRVRPAKLDAEQRSLLEALGRELAEGASRGALRADVEDARRERALAAERERIAADVHDTAGQLFVALGLLARRHMEEFPAGSPLAQHALRIAELAEQGKWQTVEAVRSIAFVPAGRRGLAPALRALVKSFAADSGIETSVEVIGRPVRLTSPVERALHRVAHEALTNAWRHAHCRQIKVELTFGTDEVVLTVVDDGIGLAGRPQSVGGHFGVGGMRRLTAEIGGKLRMRNVRPRGVMVEARVPKEPR